MTLKDWRIATSLWEERSYLSIAVGKDHTIKNGVDDVTKSPSKNKTKGQAKKVGGGVGKGWND